MQIHEKNGCTENREERMLILKPSSEEVFEGGRDFTVNKYHSLIFGVGSAFVCRELGSIRVRGVMKENPDSPLAHPRRPDGSTLY